jgi:hypothetical protein
MNTNKETLVWDLKHGFNWTQNMVNWIAIDN